MTGSENKSKKNKFMWTTNKETDENLADMFTKNLAREKFEKFASMILD